MSSAFTPFVFFLTRVVLHSHLSFQALALITIMLSHCLQFLISSQSPVHQVSKSQYSFPSWDFLLKFPIFLPKWPPFISPADLISPASSPSQVFVLDFSPQGPCLSVLTQMKSSPSILGPHRDHSFPTLYFTVRLMCPPHKSQDFSGKAIRLS